MQTISDLMPDGKERSPEALKYLREAFMAVFVNGSADVNQREAVLVDLMKVSGYHTVASVDASDGTVRELNGSRRVGGYIMQMLNFPMQKLNELERAIELEAMIDQEKGN